MASGPRGTPAVLDKLNAMLRASLKALEFVKRQEALRAAFVGDARTARAGHTRLSG